MKTTFIYELIDPRTDETRYIGKTNDLKGRYNRHLLWANRTNTYKDRWIKQLLNEGRKPIMNVIDETNSIDYWIFLEKYWIVQYKAWGFRLTNATEGGEGFLGFKKVWTLESRQKLSNSLKGENHPNFGNHHSKETLEKMSKTKSGDAQSGRKNPMFKPFLFLDILFEKSDDLIDFAGNQFLTIKTNLFEDSKTVSHEYFYDNLNKLYDKEIHKNYVNYNNKKYNIIFPNFTRLRKSKKSIKLKIQDKLLEFIKIIIFNDKYNIRYNEAIEFLISNKILKTTP